MKLNIKDVEYMIAKNVKTDDTSGKVRITTYNVSRNHGEFESEKYLEIDIFGKIGSDEYPMHFIIGKPIDEYLAIEKYKSIDIEERDILDCYLYIDGLADLDLVIRGKVTRFSKSLVFKMFFNVMKEYYGDVAFEVFLTE